MTGSTIDDIVKEHLVDGKFTFPAKLASNPGWQSVATVLFSNETLSIRGATVEVVDSTVTVTGHADFLKSKNAEVIVKFNEVADSKVDVNLALSFGTGGEPNLQDFLALFLSNVKDVPSISISTLQVTADSNEGRYSLLASLADWELTIGSTALNLTDMHMRADRSSSGKFNSLLSGNLRLRTTSVQVNAEISDSMTLTGTIDQILFEELIDQVIPGSIDLPDIVEDLRFSEVEISINPSAKEFSLSGNCQDVLSLDIGTTGLDVTALELEVSGSKDSKTTGTLTGALNLAGVSVDLVCNVPGEFKFTSTVPQFGLRSLITDLCGDSAFRALRIPGGIASLELQNATVEVNPTDKTFGVFAETDIGKCELGVGKTSKWEFVVGFQPPQNLALSKIDSSLKVFDGLDLGGIRVIMSSVNSKNLTLPTIEVPSGGVETGVNIYASLPLSKTGVDALLGIEELVVQAAVGTSPSQASLASIIDGQFNLGKGISFGDITFRLTPKPTAPSVELEGTLSTNLSNDKLDFVFETGVTPKSATGAGTMNGDWTDALGIKKVVLSNVALEFGASFAPLLPTIGIAGELQVGSFEGAAAVKFDSAVPTRSMIACSFNELELEEVAETFCPPVFKAIPQTAWDTFLNVGMEDVDMYIAPQDTAIGDLVFEAGFRLNGTIVLWGWRGSTKMEIDYSKGVELEAKLDPLSVGNVLTMSGANSNKDPALMHLEASTAAALVHISGAVSLLGIRQSLEIRGSETGFKFKLDQVYGKFMHIHLDCELSGGSFEANGSIDFDLNLTVGPLKIGGVTVIDRIRLVDVSFDAAASLKVTSSPSFFLSISGEFDAYGATIKFPTLKINASVDDFEDVYKSVVKKIEDEAGDIFEFLFSTPAEWARAIGEGAIEFAGDVANVLKNGFKQTADQCAQIMKDMGRGINEIGRGLKNVYRLSAKSATQIFRKIRASVNDVGDALKTAFRLSSRTCASVMKATGFAVRSVTQALKNAYKLSAQLTADALKHVGFAVKDVGRWVKSFYKSTKEEMARLLRNVKYAARDVANALQSAYKVSGKEAARLLKGVGYATDEVADALSDVYNMTAKEVMQAMKEVGYAAEEVLKGMRKAGKWTEKALKDAGREVGDFFKDVGGFIEKPFKGDCVIC